MSIVAEHKTWEIRALGRVSVAETYRLDLSVLEELLPVVCEITALDNAGEPCEYCQVDGQVVELQVYGQAGEHDEPVNRECCRACLRSATRDLDGVTLELLAVA
jgi:hypothetical protein